MNEIIKAMEERWSIRKFKPDMPTKEDLEQIVEAGLYAANGMGKQATITIAVTNKKLWDRLSAINAKIGGWKEGFDPFYGAPAILIVLADKNWANRVYDGSLVMGNMMLAAHSLNLGSIWIHRAKEEFELPEYQELLKEIGVEGEWEGIGHCAVGYVDGEFPKPAKRKDNRVFWVDWQLPVEQNRCAMACQGCGAVFLYTLIKSSGNQVLQVVLLSHHNQQSNRIDIPTAYDKNTIELPFWQAVLLC